MEVEFENLLGREVDLPTRFDLSSRSATRS
jgi:hypothetical protein